MRISDWSSDVCSSDLKDPLRPFSVAAAGKIVVATGTEFSVELLGRETRVILYEGHVAVLNGSAATRDTLKLFDEKPAPRSDYLMLDPGNELIVHHAATPRIDDRATMAIERPASLDTSTDWESGRSEEHTSELQSLMRITYAVFCLKKKKKKKK